jgi:hypothetical protein
MHPKGASPFVVYRCVLCRKMYAMEAMHGMNNGIYVFWRVSYSKPFKISNISKLFLTESDCDILKIWKLMQVK